MISGQRSVAKPDPRYARDLEYPAYVETPIRSAGIYSFVVTANTEPNTKRVERFDFARLDLAEGGKFERVAGGGLKIPAFISAIGIQVYEDEKGNELRELRLPEEVFDEAAIRSFENGAVTELHPIEQVTPVTWNDVAVGFMRDVRASGSRVAADLIVTDGEVIRQIEAGELIECSCGYTCDIEMVDGGLWNGEPYNAVQRRIRGNHVALGPRGWGRAGPTVQLRLDGARQVVREDDARPTAKQRKQPAVHEHAVRMDSMKTIKIDGVPFTTENADGIEAAVQKLVASKDKEIADARTKADGEIAGAKRELEETKGKLAATAAQIDTLTKERDDAKKKAEAAVMSQDEIDARVAKRVGLLDRARKFLGVDYKHAGKSDAQIMREALKKAGVSVGDDATDHFLAGAFDSAVHFSSKAADGDEEEEEEEEEETQDGGKPAAKGDSRGERVRVAPGDERPAKGPLAQVRKDNADFEQNGTSRFAMQRKTG